MRSHAAIISDAGGPQTVHERLCLGGSVHTVTSWRQRDSIPAEHWKAVSDAGLATLEELAAAAAAKREAA